MSDIKRDKSEQIGACSFLYQNVMEGDGKQCESLDQMFREAIETARKVLVESARAGQDFLPSAFIYTPMAVADGKPAVNVCLIPEGWGDHKAKREIGASLSAFAARHQAAAIVLATDGWCLRPSREVCKRYENDRAGFEAWRRKQPPPSEHPDREEALTVSCVYPNGFSVGVIQIYRRTLRPDGNGEDIAWGDQQDGREGDTTMEQSLIPAWERGESV